MRLKKSSIILNKTMKKQHNTVNKLVTIQLPLSTSAITDFFVPNFAKSLIWSFNELHMYTQAPIALYQKQFTCLAAKNPVYSFITNSCIKHELFHQKSAISQ